MWHTWLPDSNIESVVSLPIIILRGSQLSRSTKFGLAMFLCLSIFMAICAIVRIAGFHYKGVEDDTWEFFWQHAEGAVAVMMASITAFRTLFVKPADDTEATTPLSPAESLLHRVRRRIRSLARADPGEKPSSTRSTPKTTGLKLPKMPSPIFTGVRTFIRKNNRTNASVGTVNTVESEIDTWEVDYHAALKGQNRPASSKNSSRKEPLSLV
jgi:hypothetical protein